MGLFTNNPIDEAIEKATSECLPNVQEDLAASFDVCDMIRGKRVEAKTAMRSLKQRLLHRNPNVQMLTIKLTDVCFKNTGHHFLLELASREFADTVASLSRSQDTSNPVTKMSIEYLQIWALLCKDENGLGYLYEVYQELLRGGTTFPPAPKTFNKVVTKTLAPPEWIDANQCTRCRVPFSLTLRKHHCRHCGNVFCQDCSSKMASLPEMGIPDPVRICEPCYVKKNESKLRYQKSAPLPVTPPGHTDQEDDDFSLAIKLSLQESQKPSRSASKLSHSSSAVPIPTHEDEEDTMLKAAIEASLKETQKQGKSDSKPIMAQSQSVVSDIDKENVKLFSQLVDRLSLSGHMGVEPEIEALSISMQVLRDNVKWYISTERNVSPELAGILATLEISLAKYQLLKQVPMKPDIHQQSSYVEHFASPSRYHSLPPAAQHYPQAPYPVYGMPTHQQQVPSAPVYSQPQPAPQEGQLLDDEPLIKL